MPHLGLNFNFTAKLAFHGIFLQLGLVQNLQRNNELGLFLAGKIHMAKFALTERATDLKVIKSPLTGLGWRGELGVEPG
jgi:hypothetical protein